MLGSPVGNSWLSVSPLEILVTRACDPSSHEPNYAVHLEVADYINKKKANTCVKSAEIFPQNSHNGGTQSS